MSSSTAAPAASPGQFLTIRAQPDPTAAPLMRSYSLSGPPGAPEYRISVKRESHGAASGYLHTGLRVGDVLQAGAPRGSFVLEPSERPVVLISAGVGATPVLAMLHALAAERAERPVWWLHSARDGTQHSFRREVAVLLASLTEAHRLICYSRPRSDDWARGVHARDRGRSRRPGRGRRPGARRDLRTQRGEHSRYRAGGG